MPQRFEPAQKWSLDFAEFQKLSSSHNHGAKQYTKYNINKQE